MSAKKGSWYRNLGTGNHHKVRPAVGVAGVLTNIFRTICFDMNVNPYKWNSLMEEYLRHELAVAEKRRREKEARNPDPARPPVDHVELNRRDRTSIRGNLNKEFHRETMTWKVFCKTLMFLQWKRFQVIIIAEHKNGVKTEHRGPTITLDSDALDDLLPDEYPNHIPQQQQPKTPIPGEPSPQYEMFSEENTPAVK